MEAQAKFAATLKKFRCGCQVCPADPLCSTPLTAAAAAHPVHRDANPYCAMFGRLWGVYDPLPEATCDFYLEVLSHVFEAKKNADQVLCRWL